MKYLILFLIAFFTLTFVAPQKTKAQENIEAPKGNGGSKQQRDADKKKKKRLDAGYKLVKKEEEKRFKRQSKDAKKQMKATRKKSKNLKNKMRSSVLLKPKTDMAYFKN